MKQGHLIGPNEYGSSRPSLDWRLGARNRLLSSASVPHNIRRNNNPESSRIRQVFDLEKKKKKKKNRNDDVVRIVARSSRSFFTKELRRHSSLKFWQFLQPLALATGLRTVTSDQTPVYNDSSLSSSFELVGTIFSG